MAQLITIAEDRRRRRGSIIFVHGLNGHPRMTWGWTDGGDQSFWPKWLADEPELASLGVYCLQYEAKFTEHWGGSMSLLDHGENVLAVAKSNDALLRAPTAFICYSLGGLVFKQLLRVAYEQAEHDTTAKDFLDHVAQVVFIATPHRGAKLPVLCQRYRWFFRPTVIMKNLRHDEEVTLKLTRWYTNFCGSDYQGIKHLVFRETKKTHGFMIVEEASSDPGVPCESIPIEENHVDICRPKDRSSPVYQKTFELLKNLPLSCPGPVRDYIFKLYSEEPIPENIRKLALAEIRADLQQRGWRLDELESGLGCTDPEFNLGLVLAPPFLRLSPQEERWDAYAPNRYHEHLRIFARARARERSGDFFNEGKIRIASDLSKHSKDDIVIQETDYLSSLMTDQLAWVRIRSKRLSVEGTTPETELWDGKTAFLAKDRGSSKLRLKNLGEASISNQLAASTLAFSVDGCLMVVAQSDKNLRSVNMLAPSGSGSLDWSDVADSKAKDLLSLIRFGAERELREECALDDDGTGRKRIGSAVMVTGFVRILDRAGKPEFFCLGRVGALFSEICDRRPERYVERVVAAGLKRADWHADRPAHEICRVCQDYLEESFTYRGARIPLSYPLEHALRLLIEICQDSAAAAVVDEFMKGVV
jgi:hypothetical protein